MGGRHQEPITGTAAGVPFTALPPTVTVQGPVPLVVTWHMMDAPCTDPAFAAALPMTGVPAWRVHLGMPLCGTRDAVMAYLDPIIGQAAEEFPAVLAQLREQFPVNSGALGVVGGSAGGLSHWRSWPALRCRSRRPR